MEKWNKRRTDIPAKVLNRRNLAVSCLGVADAGDDDSPAVNGAIDRVVENLPMDFSARVKMNQTLVLEERNPGPMPDTPAGGRQ